MTNRRLVREILKDRPYTLILGDDEPGATSASAALDWSRQGRYGGFNGAGHLPHPGMPGLDMQAARINGTNVMEVPSGNLGTPFLGSYTVGVWLKGSYSSTNDTYQAVTGTLFRFLNYFNRPTTGRITCYFGSGNEVNALATDADKPWNDDRWHLWHWVRDTSPGTPRLTVYRDAVSAGSRNEVDTPTTNTGVLQVQGSPNVGQPSLQWTCLAFWPRVLSTQRMRVHHRTGMGLIGSEAKIGAR